MKKLLPALILIGLLMNLSPTTEAQFRKSKINTSSNFEIEQLAPRVWVAIHNDNYGKAICNAGIVDLGNRTLVFDAFMTPSAAAELKTIARQLTNKKVTLVVDSHHHNDHIRGNQAFLPEATIISTSTTKALIQKNEPAEQDWERKHSPTLLQAMKKRMANAGSADREELPYWIGYYEGIVESGETLTMTLPDQTFDDSLWIEGSKLSVKLVERRNGHTASDAVLLIPTLGIAFMGDLLCNGRHPWLSDGNIDGWRESLRLFYEDTLYHTYLPGHGKVCAKPALRTLYEYLGTVQALCKAANTDSAETVLMNQPIPAPYNTWMLGRFYQPNLQYLITAARAASQGEVDSTSQQETRKSLFRQ